MSPFFSLLSFLRKGVLFHHDLLVPLGSGSGSGACLPSSLFFLSSGKRFCSIMICWCLPSSLYFLSSGKGFCSIMICWFLSFRLGFRCLSPLLSLLWFRCLSPFFSLLSFLRKRVLFHGLVLALLFSRENSLYQFWTRLKIKDLHSPLCVDSWMRRGVASYLHG